MEGLGGAPFERNMKMPGPPLRSAPGPIWLILIRQQTAQSSHLRQKAVSQTCQSQECCWTKRPEQAVLQTPNQWLLGTCLTLIDLSDARQHKQSALLLPFIHERVERTASGHSCKGPRAGIPGRVASAVMVPI